MYHFVPKAKKWLFGVVRGCHAGNLTRAYGIISTMQNESIDLFDYASDDTRNFHALVDAVGKAADEVAAELGHRPGTLKIQENTTKSEVNYPISIFEPPYVFDSMEQLPKADGVTIGLVTLVQKSERSDHPHCTEIRLGLVAHSRLKPPVDFEIVERYSKDPESGTKELSGYSVFVRTDSPALLKYLRDLMHTMLRNYRSSVQPEFGCCDKYKECSEKGRCVHTNAMFATACQYKRNLDSGKRFY